MRKIELDITNIHTVKALHVYLAYKLNMPPYYGANLDALYDCLTSLPQETTLVLEHPSALEQALGGYARAFFRVLQDAARKNPRFHVESGEE